MNATSSVQAWSPQNYGVRQQQPQPPQKQLPGDETAAPDRLKQHPNPFETLLRRFDAIACLSDATSNTVDGLSNEMSSADVQAFLTAVAASTPSPSAVAAACSPGGNSSSSITLGEKDSAWSSTTTTTLTGGTGGQGTAEQFSSDDYAMDLINYESNNPHSAAAKAAAAAAAAACLQFGGQRPASNETFVGFQSSVEGNSPLCALRHSTEAIGAAPSLQSLSSDFEVLDAMPWGATDECLAGDVELDLAAAVARYSNAGSRIMTDAAAPDAELTNENRVTELNENASQVQPLGNAASLLCQLSYILQQERLLLQPGLPVLQPAYPSQHVSVVPAATAGASAVSANEIARIRLISALSNSAYLQPSILKAAIPLDPFLFGGRQQQQQQHQPPSLLLPINCASLSIGCLDAAAADGSNIVFRATAGPQPPPFSSDNYFGFLQSLDHETFSHLARMVARFRRTARNSSQPGGPTTCNGDSVIVSVNLCGCGTPHFCASATAGPHYHETFAPPDRPETLLSVMLVELHPDLPVVEFLDRRLPAVVRQHVGNRLDRNFVMQAYGVSLLRCNLYQSNANSWKVCDLPPCRPYDLLQLQRHPLYRHLLADLAQRPVKPKMANLTLCPIQYKPHRPLPASAAHGRNNNNHQ